MIDPKLITYAKKKTDQFEFYWTEQEDLSVQVQNNAVDFVSEGTSTGFGVRVLLDGKLGFASTLRVDHYEECIDQAIKIAKLNVKDPLFKRFPSAAKYASVQTLYPKLKQLDGDAIAEFLKEYFAFVKEQDPALKVSTAAYEKSISHLHIVNSEGVNASASFGANSFSHELVKGTDALGFGEAELLPLSVDMVKPHLERFLSLFPKEKVKTQTLPLLLHPDALGSLLSEAFTFAADAEEVRLKKSFFAGKLGKQLFDPKFSLLDTALVPGKYASRPFDDEGVASQDLPLVEKGVLKNYLYSSYEAGIAGKQSTGHAHRSYGSLPTVGPNNWIVAPGKDSFSDILGSLKKAVYVKQLLGTHTIKEATGEFSLGVYEGNLISNGNVQSGIKDGMVVGNVFELLKDITALSKDVLHAGGGFYLPYVLFPSIKLVGE